MNFNVLLSNKVYVQIVWYMHERASVYMCLWVCICVLWVYMCVWMYVKGYVYCLGILTIKNDFSNTYFPPFPLTKAYNSLLEATNYKFSCGSQYYTQSLILMVFVKHKLKGVTHKDSYQLWIILANISFDLVSLIRRFTCWFYWRPTFVGLQHPTKQLLYDHLPSITKTIQVRWTTNAGYF